MAEFGLQVVGLFPGGKTQPHFYNLRLSQRLPPSLSAANLQHIFPDKLKRSNIAGVAPVEEPPLVESMHAKAAILGSAAPNSNLTQQT
jgi:hypothetical protein